MFLHLPRLVPQAILLGYLVQEGQFICENDKSYVRVRLFIDVAPFFNWPATELITQQALSQKAEAIVSYTQRNISKLAIP